MEENNTEIENALKEFESKNNPEVIPVASSLDVSENSGMVKFVIGHSGGLIKNKKQAEYVLLGVVLLSFSITLFLIFGNFNKTNVKIPIGQIMNLPPPPEN